MTQEKNNSEMIHHLPRIKWACRRGMLELDVLLGNFLENAYQDLPDSDKKLFIKLLGYTDPELFSWLLGQSIPPDNDIARITEIIRRYARSRV